MMRKRIGILLGLVLILSFTFALADVAIDESIFPDENFRQYILDAGFDADGDGKLSDEELEAVTRISCSDKPISDVTGVEHFMNLQKFTCTNAELTSLDISQNKKLTYLNCHDNLLTSLDVSNNTALQRILCDQNKLTELDVSNNSELKELRCQNNQLTSLDVNKNTILRLLWCDDNQIANLYLPNGTAFEVLRCTNNHLTALDVSNYPLLTILYFSGNQLKSIDVCSNPALDTLDCANNQLTSLDISKNTELAFLYCEGNQLTSLDIHDHEALTVLSCWANKITKLDVSRTPLLNSLVIEANPFTRDGCLIWNIQDHDPRKEKYLGVDLNVGIITDESEIWYGGEGIEINETNFPDENFREYVAKFDTDGNSTLSDDEIAAVELIELDYSDISDLKGVEYFTALKRLYCENNQLKYLDISSNKALEVLYCAGNQLESLAVTENTKLTELYCASNKITALNLTMNTDLEILSCWDNQLTDLDVDRNTALRELICDRNGLTSLKVTKNTALLHLSCTGNQLKSLNLSNNKKLALLFCYDTRLTKLDVSKNPVLNDLVKKNKSVQADGHLEWKADADGDGEYESILAVGKDTKIVTDAIALSKVKVTAIKNQVCTGKAIKPTVVVQYKGKKLTKGTDYTVSYMDNKKVGMAKVTLTGIGDYTGTKKVTFKIVPKSVKLSSLTAGKKQLTVKWSKGTDITGYEIEYSLKKDFKTKKSIIIKKAATTKTVLKKLQAKTTYYVRIRAYKTVGGKKYYSAWSAVKNKKTK